MTIVFDVRLFLHSQALRPGLNQELLRLRIIGCGSLTMSAKACQETVEHSGHMKFVSALFYAGSSFLLTVANKTVLTSFGYVAL